MKKYIALFYLAVISVFVFPKEGIHAFYGHDDSIEEECFSFCLQHVEKKHRHCEILKLNVPVYLSTATFFVLSEPVVTPTLIPRNYFYQADFYFNLSLLRAPPAAYGYAV